jgi:hypothetical protein
MHIWGAIILHPLAVPIADQLSSVLGCSCKHFFVVYGAVFRPTVDDLRFICNHLD